MTEQKVLSAAFALVARDGLNAATMLAISREAGVSEKTVYNIFQSKSNLASKLIKLYQDSLANRYILSEYCDIGALLSSIREISMDLADNIHWSAAIAELYFSRDVDAQTYARLQSIGLRHLDLAIKLYINAEDGIDENILATARHQYANLGYALVHDLAVGRLDGNELGRQLSIGLCSTLQSLFIYEPSIRNILEAK